jgi:aspartyl/glutamyl-tRNA(Asn/Gln) amidotransferase C subunit
MADKVDIAALAKLARLEVSAEEMARLGTQLPEILAFVDTIQKANVGKEVNAPALRNVMRADNNAIETGTYTKKILDAAPARDGDRIAVKQVISRNKKS